jgi:glycosyltransferase involved in cell wall biosynthesis
MKKLLVVGAFGFREEHYDGQTIKSRNLLHLLEQKGLNPDYFETQNFKYNKLSVLTMFWKVLRCKTLFYLPAYNNLRYIFPFIYFLAKLANVRIHYFVVGGWLKEFIEDKPRLKRKLSKINGIHCETKLMKDLLIKEYGFNNVDVFPNFRISNFKPAMHHEDGKLKLVFMARVIKMKGIDTIFSLCEKIKQAGLDGKITIDFYGPQQDHEKNKDGSIEYFNFQIKQYNFVAYHGPINPAGINVTLEKYDAMLLPTHFYTEGLPGSVLDAYMSGIPVIVTQWKHAAEFVDDGQTGIIISFEDDGTELFEAVKILYNNTQLLIDMKTASTKKAYEFSADKAWGLIQKYLEP